MDPGHAGPDTPLRNFKSAVQLQSVDTHVSPELQGSVDQPASHFAADSVSGFSAL